MKKSTIEDNISQQPPSGNVYRLDSIHAYIFVRTQGGDMNRMLENAKKLTQVTSTAVVAGDYDLVMKVQVQTLEQLMKVTDKIQCLHGILQTSTH
ncbi:MAG: Lrp/AsnC ligand binding domain-containing protein, partial [Thermoplasmata archaeon]|nr:Lrp/AsnC ligand binding domain-containing protein [Thermoplasmata archaeon]